MQRLENQGVLEDNSFADREPMKLPQDRSDMVLALHASDKACGGILNGILKGYRRTITPYS